jgi:S-DNA-T family DNA segregation ATPase FtsK/SpoIIIE
VLVKADDLPTTLALLRGDDIPVDGPSAGLDDDDGGIWVDTDDPGESEDAWDLTGRDR